MDVFAWLLTMLLTAMPLPSFSPPAPTEVHQLVTFDQFYSAIAEQESGGNYKAKGVWTGGDRAYGKYQIMGANLPSWGRQYLGFVPSPQDFLNHPEWQEKMARGKLQDYFNKYGARGAASAWYSGNPKLSESTRSQYGGPSIKGYVDSVISKAGKYPSGGGSSSGSSSGGGGVTATPMSRGETAESYGFVEALMNSNPELKALFDKAVKGSWSAQKFQASLRDTRWFKTTSETERQFLMKHYGDPATTGQMWNIAQTKIRQMAGQAGAEFGWDVINRFAYGVMAQGWTDGKLRDEMARYVNFGASGADMKGEAGKAAQDLHEFAYNMGIEMDKSWYQHAAQGIISGKNVMQDFENDLRKNAKALYPSWAKQIDGGQSVMDLASPYLQSMAQILELPAGSVNLFDPTIKRALQYKDPTSGQSSVKQIWQFENDLRNDERWKKTKNAQDSMFQVAHQVLSDFGVKF